MPEKMNLVTPGDIKDEAGEIVGEHTGLPIIPLVNEKELEWHFQNHVM